MSQRTRCILSSVVILWLAFITSAADPVRVACIGDSITYGSGIRDRETKSYPACLARMLGTNYLVQNFGVSGTTLLVQADRPYVKTRAYTNALEFDADVFVINLGTNDSKHRGDGSLDSENAIDNWRFATNYVRDYKALIASFRRASPDATVYVCFPTPNFPGRWGINGRTIREEIIPMIQQVAEETQSTIIDLYAPLADESGLFPDTVHPNEDGARLMAEAVCRALTATRTVNDAVQGKGFRAGASPEEP